MKNLLLTLAFLFTLCSTVFAQIEFGIKAGPMLSNVITQDYDTISFTRPNQRISSVAGFFATIGLSDNLTLQPELLYANKGIGPFDRRFGRTEGLHYLNIPVMFQYNLWRGLNLGLGPELGILLNRDLTLVNDFDLGLNVGASYALTDRWLIDIRYNRGLVDNSNAQVVTAIDPVTTEFTTINPKSTNRSLQLTVGYRLR
jgi:hypothetical protein